MPTFERCQGCVAGGVPPEDSPIVPEGRWCVGCERKADEKATAAVKADEKATAAVIIKDGVIITDALSDAPTWGYGEIQTVENEGPPNSQGFYKKVIMSTFHGRKGPDHKCRSCGNTLPPGWQHVSGRCASCFILDRQD